MSASSRCQSTGRHSGVSDLDKDSAWNKEAESKSLTTMDVETRWGNRPVKARSCDMYNTPSSKKSTRGIAIVKVLLSTGGVWQNPDSARFKTETAAKEPVKPLLGSRVFRE